MRFVDYDDRVLPQKEVELNFSKEDTVRHKLDSRIIANILVVTNLVANFISERNIKLFSDPLRCGCDRNTPRLCDRNRARMTSAFWIAIAGFV